MDSNNGKVYPKSQQQQRQQNTNKLEKKWINKLVNQFKKNYTKQVAEKKINK